MTSADTTHPTRAHIPAASRLWTAMLWLCAAVFAAMSVAGVVFGVHDRDWRAALPVLWCGFLAWKIRAVIQHRAAGYPDPESQDFDPGFDEPAHPAADPSLGANRERLS